MKKARCDVRLFYASRQVKNGFFYSFNVEVTGAARLYRAASVWTAGLAIAEQPGPNWTSFDFVVF
jgi:hypothetical protein